MFSHEKKIIFIHIPKTAGTSITDLLKDNTTNKKFRYNNHGKLRVLPDILDYHKHSSSSRYEKLLGENLYSEYFKFTFVRNPWDRMVSWFEYARLGRPYNATEFERWIDMVEARSDDQMHKFMENGIKKVDFIGRFENLEEDMSFVLKETGLEEENLLNLKKLNQSTRMEDYTRYYTPFLKEKVEKIFEEEIEYFKYRF